MQRLLDLCKDWKELLIITSPIWLCAVCASIGLLLYQLGIRVP
jgi:hypothetical protein